MGVNALKDSLGTERKDAQEFYNQYFEAFPRLAAYLRRQKQMLRGWGTLRPTSVVVDILTALSPPCRIYELLRSVWPLTRLCKVRQQIL